MGKVFVALTALVTTASASAIAAPREAEICSRDAEDGQQLRSVGRYIAARAKFLACAIETCPALVKADCTKWAAEILESQPSLIFDARDDGGSDRRLVTVMIDGAVVATELDGRPVPIDPGPHTLRFLLEGYEPVTKEIVAKENAKKRVIDVRFTTPAQPSDLDKPPPEPPTNHTIYPWIVVGAGGVSTILGIYFFAARPSTLPAFCSGSDGKCLRVPGEAEDTYQERVTQADKHNNYPAYGAIGLALGGALVVSGLVWHFLEPPAPTRAARIRLTPSGVAGTF